MEPNKLEKHFRKTFAEREIQPSPEAWHKINNEIKKDKTRANLPWLRYASAAAIVLFVFGAVFYFDKQNTQEFIIPANHNLEETIVNSDADKHTPIEKQKREDTRGNIVAEDIEKPIKSSANPTKIKVSSKSNPHPQNTEVTRTNTKEAQNVIKELPKDKTDLLIDRKIEEVMAEVMVLESNKNELSDIEVEALLVKAQKEILDDALFRPDHSIDPNTLLSQVENELDQSFRDQIFDKLKTGFKKVRTAVADRNN
ncbi:hypothetical protein [Eudoraea chungangensis]|uniref:hypothetical protein n=1 Tax=Eudoraea chungangensis TaxID=1481905 RepID=UPI0023EAAE54|nr:hypothetical protein [Eudoraea chungangensis]